MPGGDLENPEGNPPGPRAGAEAEVRRKAPNGARSGGLRARRVARGIFKIPDGLRGFVAKTPEQKSRILRIFFQIISLQSQITLQIILHLTNISTYQKVYCKIKFKDSIY